MSKIDNTEKNVNIYRDERLASKSGFLNKKACQKKFNYIKIILPS